MNGGLWATVFTVLTLVLTFLLGKKTGQTKEDEKLRDTITTYTEKIKEEKVASESAERKADLAVKVAQTVADTAEQRTSAVASLSEIRETLTEQSAIEEARKQAEIAKGLL